MKEHLHLATAGGTSAGTSLSQLVNRLARTPLLAAGTTQTSFTNEIASDVITIVDEQMIQPVLEELLNTVISFARKGRIYVTAERYKDIIVLQVQEQNNYNGYALSTRIKALEPMARAIGGFISIKGEQQLKTTISLSFPDEKISAGFRC